MNVKVWNRYEKAWRIVNIPNLFMTVESIQGHEYDFDHSTLCKTTTCLDSEGTEIYEADFIELETIDKKLMVDMYSGYLAPRPNGGVKLMNSLICRDTDDKYYQLIQRSDGTWIFENSIMSTPIKVIGNKYDKK